MARPVIRDPTMEQLSVIMDEHEYNTVDEAVRHLLREYDDE